MNSKYYKNDLNLNDSYSSLQLSVPTRVVAKPIVYAIIYKSGVVLVVSKRKFEASNGYIFIKGNVKCKMVGFKERKLAFEASKCYFASVQVYGLDYFKKIKSAVDNFQLIMNSRPVHAVAHLNFKWSNIVSNALLLIRAVFRGWSLDTFIDIALICSSMFLNSDVQAQSIEGLEPLFFASLPLKVRSFIHEVQKFSSIKVLENSSILIPFLLKFKQLLYWFFSFFGSYGQQMQKLFDEWFICLEHYAIIANVKQLLDKFKEGKMLLVKQNREEIFNLKKKLDDCAMCSVLDKKDPAASFILNKFRSLFKLALSYEEVGRKEPVCIVFEGPPGVGKSVTLNQLITSVGEPVYTHVVKSMSDGKDFYDTYNGEKIFCMDDVGQQGLSQWRTIINMVSSIKLPLDCAAANLKDSKFFSSELIYLTTNNLQNVGFPLRNDGITDIHALFRRCYILDFKECSSFKGNVKGTVRFKTYNLRNKMYEEVFPKDLEDLFRSHGCFHKPFVVCDGTKESQFILLQWIKDISDGLTHLRSLFKNSSVLDDEDLSILKINKFSAESQFSSLNYLSKFKERIEKYISNFNIKDACVVTLLSSMFAWSIWELISWFSKPQELKIQVPTIDQYNTAITTIKKNLFEFDAHCNDTVKRGCCLMSGHLLITVAHGFVDVKEFQLVLYKSKVENMRLIDMMTVKSVYVDKTKDLSIFALPSYYPTPFKSMAKFFSKPTSKGLLFCSPLQVIDLDTRLVNVPGTVFYQADKFINALNVKEDSLSYDFGGKGLCGSLVVSKDGCIRGMHVAGNDKIKGYSIIYSDFYVSKIRKILESDSRNLLSVEISDKVIKDFSGVKLDTSYNCFTPKKTNFVKSPIYGLFPVTREPVNLVCDGPHTIKTIEKQSFSPVVHLKSEEVEFVKSMSQCEFGVKSIRLLTEKEVILGTPLLAGLNRKSSNGLNCDIDKANYVDFDNGKFTEKFSKELLELENRIILGDIRVDDIIWKATLKDELRNVEKLGKPRSFKISRIHLQVLTKKYFGGLVENVISRRKSNKIMVGCNPFEEWESIYNSLVSCYGVWAGDIGSYDSKMLPQLQEVLIDLFGERTEGSVDVAKFLLACLPYSIVAINDDVYLSTHSMPSGTFLTAIFNSIVNRMYTYIWFYRNYKGNNKLSDFKKYVLDYVYGDDKLNGILLKDDNSSALNALTMKQTFESFGMKFTKADKTEVDCAFEDICDVSFLKRKFVFHYPLQKIVAPLDLRTIYSSISWVDSTKDERVVLRDKLHCFQREMYLHHDMFKSVVNTLKNHCLEKNVEFDELDEDYLFNLYLCDVNSYYDKGFEYF